MTRLTVLRLQQHALSLEERTRRPRLCTPKILNPKPETLSPKHTRVLCRHADCSVPQEAPDEVIDNLLQDQAQSMHLARYLLGLWFVELYHCQIQGPLRPFLLLKCGCLFTLCSFVISKHQC